MELFNVMRSDQMVKKFRNLISYSKEKNDAISCNEVFEEMYGEVTAKIAFDLKAFV